MKELIKNENKMAEVINDMAISTDYATAGKHYQRCINKNANDITQLDFDFFDAILDNYCISDLSIYQRKIYNEILEFKLMLADRCVDNDEKNEIDVINNNLTAIHSDMAIINTDVKEIITSQNEMIDKLDTLL